MSSRRVESIKLIFWVILFIATIVFTVLGIQKYTDPNKKCGCFEIQTKEYEK